MAAERGLVSEPAGFIRKLGELVDTHGQPAHDEDAYYNPPPRANPWEGIGQLVMAASAGLAAWLVWAWLTP